MKEKCSLWHNESGFGSYIVTKKDGSQGVFPQFVFHHVPSVLCLTTGKNDVIIQTEPFDGRAIEEDQLPFAAQGFGFMWFMVRRLKSVF